MTRTYKQAQEEILAYLHGLGWSLPNQRLEVPHASSPDGTLRLWFKPQAVHYTEIEDSRQRHDRKNARAISYDLDIRKHEPVAFVKLITRYFPKASLGSPVSRGHGRYTPYAAQPPASAPRASDGSPLSKGDRVRIDGAGTGEITHINYPGTGFHIRWDQSGRQDEVVYPSEMIHRL